MHTNMNILPRYAFNRKFFVEKIKNWAIKVTQFLENCEYENGESILCT